MPGVMWDAEGLGGQPWHGALGQWLDGQAGEWTGQRVPCGAQWREPEPGSSSGEAAWRARLEETLKSLKNLQPVNLLPDERGARLGQKELS